MRNGKVARTKEGKAALGVIMLKKLREKVYELAGPEDVDNILPANLVDKPTADPPYRLTQTVCAVNDEMSPWRVRYEGCHTVPLTVKEGDWLFNLDLKSGYDQVLLQESSRRLFGMKVYMNTEQLGELEKEGLLDAVTAHYAVGPRDKAGGAWVTVRPRVLV